MDGGICSQMHQYLLGQIFADKGFKVEYDLSFFKDCGKDILGQFERNFDITKAFPHLELSRSAAFSTVLYKTLFYHSGNFGTDDPKNISYTHLRPPVYLGGWYHDPDYLWSEMYGRFFRIDYSVLDDQNKKMIRVINEKKVSVAIHVRRGDLKVYNEAYGAPASTRYFAEAALYFKEKYQDPYFFLFSDEPLWVKEELVPQMPALKENYRVVDVNDSRRGYMDLFLMAACTAQIGSKGSLGKFAFLLNENTDKEIVLCNDATESVWTDRLNHPIFI